MDRSKYSENYIGHCLISTIQDIPEGIIYIIDTQTNLGVNLYNEKRGICNYPPKEQVFAVDFGADGLYRAIVTDDGNTWMGSWTLFLIDIGEEIQYNLYGMKKNHALYYISEKAQSIAAQCIHCKVLNIFNENGAEMILEETLGSMLYEPYFFLVERVASGFLEISLHAIRATISEKIANNLEQFEITEEQRQIFYEEESSTTNALKAVLGYEPKDEKRICKHYDPKTGRCFKGNSCPYEHVKLMEDGWTRDKEEASLKLIPQEVPCIDSIVDAIVTCVVSVGLFYVYLPENMVNFGVTLESLKRNMNEDSMVQQYRKLKTLPGDYEMVLFKFNEKFYRGKVQGIYSQGVEITFVDYGYMEFIDPNEIYEWHPRWNVIPEMVFQCSFNGLSLWDANDEYAIKELRQMILGQIGLKIRIIDNRNGLLVDLLDEQDNDIGELLCKFGWAKQEQQLIPDYSSAFTPA